MEAIRSRRVRSVLVASILCAGAACHAAPAGSAPQVPPDETYTITARPETVRPGGVITFTGVCWLNEVEGGTTHASVRGYLIAPQPGSPFDFFLRPATRVDRTDGSFSGRITVPADAPTGKYRLSSQCFTEDWVVGGGRAEFVVAGKPLATTSTTSTTSATPTTTPTLPPRSTTTTAVSAKPVPPPVPAEPRRTDASYTG